MVHVHAHTRRRGSVEVSSYERSMPGEVKPVFSKADMPKKLPKASKEKGAFSSMRRVLFTARKPKKHKVNFMARRD